MELQKRLENKNDFIKLLNSTKRKGMDKVLEWLEKSDFYEAPASTRFHGNYEGGLLEHSLNVLIAFDRIIVGLSGITTPAVPKESIIITSLLHDICKANTYKKVQRWRKRKYIVADSTKFNAISPVHFADFEDAVIITNKEVEGYDSCKNIIIAADGERSKE